MLFRQHCCCRRNAVTITRPCWSLIYKGHANRPGTIGPTVPDLVFLTLSSVLTFCFVFVCLLRCVLQQRQCCKPLWRNRLIYLQEFHTSSHFPGWHTEWFNKTLLKMIYAAIKEFGSDCRRTMQRRSVLSLTYSIHNWLKFIGRNFFCKCYARHDKSYSSHYSATMRALCRYDHFPFLLAVSDATFPYLSWNNDPLQLFKHTHSNARHLCSSRVGTIFVK